MMSNLGGEAESAIMGGGGKVSGQWALERIKRTRRQNPEVVYEAAVDSVGGLGQ